jgi:hypothetical protein
MAMQSPYMPNPWGKEFTDAVKDSYTASLEYYSGLFNQSLEIWVTETGQNITTSGKLEQAQYLSEALDYFSDTSVSRVFWYALHDENSTRCDFGLIGANMQPRQAYATLKANYGN